MGEEIKIVPYGPDWEMAHTVFASKHYPNIRRRSPSYLYWKFRGKPGQENPAFILAVKGDEVIGQLGLIPVDVAIREKIYPGQWFCEHTIDPKFRGTGLVELLYKRAYSYGRISLGSDASPSAHGAMVKRGFTSVNSYHKYFVPVSIGKTLSLKLPFMKYFSWVKHPLLWVLSRFQKWEGILPCNDVETIKATILAKGYKGSSPHILHDNAFLDWRFTPFENLYSPPLMFRFANGDFFGYVKSNGMLFLSIYHFSTPANLGKAICFLWKIANDSKLSCISLLADKTMEKSIKKYGVMKRPVACRILAHNHPDFGEGNFFHYTYIDSDENI